jgi:hypothetical protein
MKSRRMLEIGKHPVESFDSPNYRLIPMHQDKGLP